MRFFDKCVIFIRIQILIIVEICKFKEKIMFNKYLSFTYMYDDLQIEEETSHKGK
ncbi:hypothetical protein UREOM_3380 [Ureaplasma sp. OM1]|uniref:Uncharacterized protein n=1 Tax=Ureaplasma ceti TaxID=3119530 RepID=A0ABP9U8X8_9BACT